MKKEERKGRCLCGRSGDPARFGDGHLCKLSLKSYYLTVPRKIESNFFLLASSFFLAPVFYFIVVDTLVVPSFRTSFTLLFSDHGHFFALLRHSSVFATSGKGCGFGIFSPRWPRWSSGKGPICRLPTDNLSNHNISTMMDPTPPAITEVADGPLCLRVERCLGMNIEVVC